MENKEICRVCRGLCCKSCGCHFSPDDFKEITFESLKKEIDKGNISIDWWDGSPFVDNDIGVSSDGIERAYYLRMRNQDSPIVDPSWGGQCSLLTDTGCPLSYEERPKGARELIPISEGRCYSNYTKKQACKDWYEYDDILRRLVEIY